MKKLIFTLAVVALALVSCDKKESDGKGGATTPAETNSTYIDATSKTTWHYFSFADNKVVGTGEETTEDNAKWFARTDWDIAISTSQVRTNSGDATTAGAKGGVAITSGVILADITSIPTSESFKIDKKITSTGMGGVATTKIYSEATVIQLKKDAEGNTIMPPVFLKSPVYVFRAANGTAHYKLEFTQYQNAEKKSGHVKFSNVKM